MQQNTYVSAAHMVMYKNSCFKYETNRKKEENQK